MQHKGNTFMQQTFSFSPFDVSRNGRTIDPKPISNLGTFKALPRKINYDIESVLIFNMQVIT